MELLLFIFAQQSWWTYLLALAIIAVVVITVWLLGKLFPSKATTAAGNALMRAEVFFNPSREHVIEAKQREQKEDSETGEPE